MNKRTPEILNESVLSLDDYTEIPEIYGGMGEYVQHVEHTNKDNRAKELNRKAVKGVVIACGLVLGFVGVVYIIYNVLLMGIGFIENITSSVDIPKTAAVPQMKEIPIQINGTIDRTNDFNGYLMDSKYITKMERAP